MYTRQTAEQVDPREKLSVADSAERPRDPVSVVLCVPESSLGVGLRTLIEAEPDIVLVGQDADAGRLVRLCGEVWPRVVVLNLASVGSAAIDVTLRLGQLGGRRNTQVLLLVDDSRHDVMFAAIRAGARGAALRDGPAGEIVAAIRALGRGHGYVAAGLSRHVLDHLAACPPPTEESSRAEELTCRERAVLELIAAGMSNSEIAGILSVTERTVKYHVSNILRTLGVRDRLQAVSLVYGTGPGGRSAVLGYRPKTGP